MKRPKWIWSQVRRFSVKSCADGTLIVEPDYFSKWTPAASADAAREA